MRHHPIAADVPCPHCGRPGLVFIAKTHIGDKYQCHACQHAVMHTSNGARKRGGRGCGLRAVVHAQYGPLQPCAKVAK